MEQEGNIKTNTAGVINTTNDAYGVAYVYENEDIKLGKSFGYYTGLVHNTYKFKDIGRSKEEMLQVKVGAFKSIPFDYNNSLNWTVSGDISYGYNKMHRKFLVVNEIFNARGRYNTYGVAMKNELGKEFRLTETISLRPYGAINLEYMKVGKVKEKSGEKN
ncbi:autotransporter outer membrane beta-barrel domain-containing protein [Fusobacterium vincentii]